MTELLVAGGPGPPRQRCVRCGVEMGRRLWRLRLALGLALAVGVSPLRVCSLLSWQKQKRWVWRFGGWWAYRAGRAELELLWSEVCCCQIKVSGWGWWWGKGGRCVCVGLVWWGRPAPLLPFPARETQALLGLLPQATPPWAPHTTVAYLSECARSYPDTYNNTLVSIDASTTTLTSPCSAAHAPGTVPGSYHLVVLHCV